AERAHRRPFRLRPVLPPVRADGEAALRVRARGIGRERARRRGGVAPLRARAACGLVGRGVLFRPRAPQEFWEEERARVCLRPRTEIPFESTTRGRSTTA